MTGNNRAVLCIGLLAAIGFGGGSAEAGQQQWSSQYVDWTSDGQVTSVYNIDQVVWIAKPNVTSYWPMQWEWAGDSGTGGYMGLQQGATAQDGTVRFSIWNATQAKGSNCMPFGGEGIGETCTLNVKISPKKWYRLRLWRLSGNWWGGWLIDTTSTGALRERMIGRILAPTAAGPDPNQVNNFVEYWGDSVAECKDVPLSKVAFLAPALNYQGAGSGIYAGYYTYAGSTKADGNLCTTGTESTGAFITAEPRDFGFAQGVVMYLGGTLKQHTLSASLTPPPLPND